MPIRVKIALSKQVQQYGNNATWVAFSNFHSFILLVISLKDLHCMTWYYAKQEICWKPSNKLKRLTLYDIVILRCTLVTQPMIQRRLNPTELRSIDCYIQILCRFQKSKQKVPPPPPPHQYSKITLHPPRKEHFSHPLGGKGWFFSTG